MKGILKTDESLAPHTSWHVGGLADHYYKPVDSEDLAEFLAQLSNDEPLTWLGLGSNVLIADAGIRGTVIHTLGMKSDLIVVDKIPIIHTVGAGPCPRPDLMRDHVAIGPDLIQDHAAMGFKIIRAEAGIPCAKVAKLCAREGLSGGEFFAGIPGTIGGALAMNAGAFGGETWRQVVLVEVVNRKGERKFRTPLEYEIGYRTVKGLADTEEWFIAGYFQFALGDASESTLRIKELLRKRNESQPIGVFSCGSVFKNPKEDHAGRLIEASQLKGFKIGDAEVSLKHANFILNLGHATARDILQLIEHITAVVLKDHNVYLHPEVRMLGF